MTGAEASQAALSIKPAVKEFAELWKEFPDGGSFGWFAFVNEAKTFAYWDIDLEDWVLFSRESNMNSTYVSLLIDAFVESTPTISDYLIGSGKKRFTVQSIVDLFKIPTAFTEAFQTLSQNVDGLSSTISDKQDAIQNNITLLFVGDCSEGFPNVSSNGELVFDTSTQRLYSSFNIGGLWQWIDIDIRQDTVYVCKKSYYLGNQQSSTLIKLSDGDALPDFENAISILNDALNTETNERTNAISDLAAEIQTVSNNSGNKSSKISLSAISETAPTGMPPTEDLLALCTSTGQLYKSAELSYAPGAYAWEEIQADPQSIYYYGDTTYFVSGGLLKKVGESALAVVNNLTDGGITAPLSAEMGKTLNDMLAFLSYTVDVETSERTNADIVLSSSIQTVSNGLATKVDKAEGYSLVLNTEIAKIHSRNTDSTLLSEDGTKSIYLDNAGVFHVGKISQSGESYETHAEQIFTTKNEIILRDGAIAGLAVGEYVGFRAKLYDGVNDGLLVYDKDGFARVGDVGALSRIATIQENPTNNQFTYYDSETLSLKTRTLLASDIPTLSQSQIANLTSDLSLLAPKLNPIFSGVVHNSAPTYTSYVSLTADTVGDTRFQVVAGVRKFERCTGANAAKGGGTWVTDMSLDANGKTLIGATSPYGQEVVSIIDNFRIHGGGSVRFSVIGGTVQFNENGGNTNTANAQSVGRFNIGTLGIASIGLTIQGLSGQTGDLFRIDKNATIDGRTFAVKASGNVLVNTTTDNGTDKLQVNGSILGTELKTSAGTLTYGANDSAGAGFRFVRVPNI